MFMTLRTDVAPGRDLLSRWCTLAETRLEYLTEMFESGRWRRFYSEVAFLENIREAKVAVETWRGLSTPGAAAAVMGPSPIEISWSGQARAARMRKLEPYAAAVATEPQPQVEFVSADDVEEIFSDEEPSTPAIDMTALEQALDNPVMLDLTAIEQRYPLLRNTL
jgi:uncharacterized repeat protein (TIGR03809 family)